MGKYNIFYLFENPRRGMQARNFTSNVPKILDLKSSSEQIFPRKLSLGAPVALILKEKKGLILLCSIINTHKQYHRQVLLSSFYLNDHIEESILSRNR